MPERTQPETRKRFDAWDVVAAVAAVPVSAFAAVRFSAQAFAAAAANGWADLVFVLGTIGVVLWGIRDARRQGAFYAGVGALLGTLVVYEAAFFLAMASGHPALVPATQRSHGLAADVPIAAVLGLVLMAAWPSVYVVLRDRAQRRSTPSA